MGKRKAVSSAESSAEDYIEEQISQDVGDTKRKLPSRKAREVSNILLASLANGDDELNSENSDNEDSYKPKGKKRKSAAKPTAVKKKPKPTPKRSVTIVKPGTKSEVKVLPKKEVIIKEEKPKIKKKTMQAVRNILPIVLPPLGKKYLGAHVSILGGLFNSVLSALEIGATSFALFLKSQRQWKSKPLGDEEATKFRETIAEHNFPTNMILPHGSYLLNCGSPNPETLEKSREALVDELQRCEKLGIELYNFHPGSTCDKISREECINLIAETINLAHEKTKTCVTLVENMSKQGHTIGGDLKELRSIIDKIKDKKRIGVCIDTCHAHAAGYDLSTEDGYNSLMTDIESIIGLEYLRAVHLNDSKGEAGCHLDRHMNIGKGKIGIEGFRRIMNDPRFNDIPIILETPAESDEVYEKEIKQLQELMVK